MAETEHHSDSLPRQSRRQEITKFFQERDVLSSALILAVIIATAYSASEFFVAGRREMAVPWLIGSGWLLSLMGK
jgi:hypothetical protein